MKYRIVAVLFLASGGTAQAQEVERVEVASDLPTTDSPPEHASTAGFERRRFTAEEISAIPVPDISFMETEEMRDDYKKYYFFHRADTSFDEAFADIEECDALASGISYHAVRTTNYPTYYGPNISPTAAAVGGAIGSALGSLMADAIFGSGQRRAIRRVNMRNCMGFKGYSRYGLPKEMWQEFNFEEGHGREEEDVRDRMLMQQALVASGPKPKGEVLEL